MKTNLSVQNLQCTRCVSSINNALLKINGVYGVEVNIANQRVLVDHTENVSLDSLSKELDKLGYPVATQDLFGERAGEWDLNPVRINQSEKFFKQVAQVVPLLPNFKVLDFGCGTGLVGLHFAPFVGRLVMVDSSPGMLNELHKKLSILALDTTKVELLSDIAKHKENDIDLIVSMMTLHHIEDVSALLAVFFNKLNKDGYIAIGDLMLEDGSFHDEYVPHYGFDPQDICAKLIAQGFQLVQCASFNELSKETKNGLKDFEQFLIIAKK